MARWLVFVLAVAGPAAAADVELGGPRPVRGSVALAGAHYEVTVAFPPVRAFDPATNGEVNRELATEYALRVLALHLSKEAEVEFATGGDAVVSAGIEGEQYRAVIRWPKDRVKVLREAKKTAPAAARRVSATLFTGGFFTARRDYLDTLAGLQAAHTRAVQAVETAGRAEPVAGRRRALARAVADLEERGTAALDALARDVRADPRLLDTTERPEILAAIDVARAVLLRTLTAVLAGAAGPEERLPFRDVAIDPAYEPYLQARPLLLELGGAAVADAGGGERVVLGVAKTLLETGDAADLLRGERVCTLKARAAVVADREGTQVTYLKKVGERVLVVTDAAGERAAVETDRLTLIRERAAGMTQGLAVVGRWRSEDGRVFYLAVGGRFDTSGKPIRP